MLTPGMMAPSMLETVPFWSLALATRHSSTPALPVHSSLRRLAGWCPRNAPSPVQWDSLTSYVCRTVES